MEWISVKERLPEEDERILVAVLAVVDDHSIGELRRVPMTLVGSIYSCAMGIIANCDDDCEYLGEHILGWMALPEPPAQEA